MTDRTFHKRITLPVRLGMGLFTVLAVYFFWVKTAILDIGGGSIQISLFDKDTLVSTQNLRLGVLRLQELLNHLNAGSTQMEQLVDELATAQLDDYKKLYLKDREIKNIIIVDD